MDQDLILKKIYDVVRHENAVLWIGAGLSLSAGYPSGKVLRDQIFKKLSKSQRKLVDESLPLPGLAEEFEKINESRDKLILLIKQIFDRVPEKVSPVHYHLSKIFHFNSIVTTNYDPLIENGYGFKCQVIRPKDSISSINPRKVQVFKVHGDFVDQRNIVLTNSDYNKFFESNKENEGLWTIIKEKFYTKNIIFIGYNLEDPNVLVLFNRIIKQLDNDKKEAFLIAPNLQDYKIKDLKKRGVSYYNSTGERFIENLSDHLNKIMWKDVEEGVCSIDTFSKSAHYRNVAFEIGSEGQKIKIKSLYGLNDQVRTNLNLTFSKDSLIAEQLERLVSGKNIEPVTIDAKLFENLELKVGDLYWGTGNDFKELILKRTANYKTKADFIFGDNWEFNGVDIQFYGGQKYSNAKLNLKSAVITLQAGESSGKKLAMDFSYIHSKVCAKVAEEVNLYSFLQRISNGDKFDIFFDDNLHSGISFGKAEQLYEHTCEALDQFQKLKKIEDYYKIRFHNIRTSQLTIDAEKKINQIISFIDQIPESIDDWVGKLTANIDLLNNKTIKSFKEEIHSKSSIFWQEDYPSKVSLFNKEFEVGYSYSIIEEPRISIVEKNGKNLKISINSRNKILRTGFMQKRLEGENFEQN